MGGRKELSADEKFLPEKFYRFPENDLGKRFSVGCFIGCSGSFRPAGNRFFGRSGFGCDAAAAVCCPGVLCFFAAAALHSLAGRSCFPVGGSACLRGISGMEFVIFNLFCYLCPNK